MSLKVELKPGERLIVGDSLITNANQRTRLYIDGTAPILREKDILTTNTADTPAKHVYFAIQLMYLQGDGDVTELQKNYEKVADDFCTAAPSAKGYIDDINKEILTHSLYKALKAARRLISYEQEIMGHAEPGDTGISARSQTNR